MQFCCILVLFWNLRILWQDFWKNSLRKKSSVYEFNWNISFALFIAPFRWNMSKLAWKFGLLNDWNLCRASIQWIWIIQYFHIVNQRGIFLLKNIIRCSFYTINVRYDKKTLVTVNIIWHDIPRMHDAWISSFVIAVFRLCDHVYYGMFSKLFH